MSIMTIMGQGLIHGPSPSHALEICHGRETPHWGEVGREGNTENCHPVWVRSEKSLRVFKDGTAPVRLDREQGHHDHLALTVSPSSMNESKHTCHYCYSLQRLHVVNPINTPSFSPHYILCFASCSTEILKIVRSFPSIHKKRVIRNFCSICGKKNKGRR